jgi:hypothetical protein
MLYTTDEREREKKKKKKKKQRMNRSTKNNLSVNDDRENRIKLFFYLSAL